MINRQRLRSPAFLAKLSISAQFLPLVRCLAEYFRLKLVAGPAFAPASAEPFILCALVAALVCWLSVLLYFAGWFRAVLLATVLLLAILIAMKILLVGA